MVCRLASSQGSLGLHPYAENTQSACGCCACAHHLSVGLDTDHGARIVSLNPDRYTPHKMVDYRSSFVTFRLAQVQQAGYRKGSTIRLTLVSEQILGAVPTLQVQQESTSPSLCRQQRPDRHML